MGKVIPNAVFDAALDNIADNANELCVCSQEPASYTEAHATYKLASVAMTVGDGNGDYTIQEGQTSGRRITVAEQANISISASGDATHVVLTDTVNQLIKQVTTCSTQALTAGGTVTVPSYNWELRDPA